jgi:hypothetical protein
MGLNDIELPASVVASLYPSALVAAGTDQPASAAATPAGTVPVSLVAEPAAPAKPATAAKDTDTTFKWKFLGNNQRNILVVVDHPDILHLPDEDLTFLTAMLTACKLGLGDITLTNYDHYREISGPAIIKQFKSRTVLLFGIEPAGFGLPVNFPGFQVQGLANVDYLYAPALAGISGDKALKSKLWVCLKKIFAI